MKAVIADVSHHNSVYRFNREEIDGVIIRATYGYSGKDRKLEEHVRKAELAGLPYGFYHFSYAITEDEAKRNADNFIREISHYNPTLPCAIDMESDNASKTLSSFWSVENKKTITNIARIQLEELERAGYYSMLYGNVWDINNITTDEYLRKRYALWVAKWGEPAPSYDTMKLWQNTATGRVDGIYGEVDLSIGDVSFLNLVEKMKSGEKDNDTLKPLNKGDKVMCYAENDIYGKHLADFVRKTPCYIIGYKESSDAYVISTDKKTPTAVVPSYMLERC